MGHCRTISWVVTTVLRNEDKVLAQGQDPMPQSEVRTSDFRIWTCAPRACWCTDLFKVLTAVGMPVSTLQIEFLWSVKQFRSRSGPNDQIWCLEGIFINSSKCYSCAGVRLLLNVLVNQIWVIVGPFTGW